MSVADTNEPAGPTTGQASGRSPGRVPPTTSTLDSVSPLGWKEAKPRHHVAYIVPTVRQLLGEIKPGTRVLDLGCGNGAISSIIVDDVHLENGCTLVGLDPSESGIALAREHHPRARWERMVADENVLSELGEEPFDVVLSLEVVEHVYAPRSWARACHAALKPGGKLVCSTPYHGYLKNLVIAASGKSDGHYQPLKDGGHIKFWSRQTLERLLIECGFRPTGFAGAGRWRWLWKSMLVVADRA